RIKYAEDKLRAEKETLEETVLERTNKLRESEGKYKALYENAPLSYQSLNEDGSFRDVNPTWLSTLGYVRDEIIGKKFEDLLHPKWKPHFEKHFPVFKKRGYVHDVEFKIRHKTGHYLDIMFEGCIGYNPDGSFKETYCVFQDITTRIRSERIKDVLFNISNAVITTEGLKELMDLIQKELAKIIDTSNLYIALYDSKTDMFSLPLILDERDQMTSFPADKTFSKYVIETQKSLLADKYKVKEMIKSGEVDLIGTASEIWLGVPLPVEGEIKGVLAMQSYTDINAYDESDMELLEFISEQVGISIGRKQAEEDLLVALDMAKESDRLKSAFLANVSHEIRTPLNSILGFSDLMTDPDLEDDEKEKYKKIIHSGGSQLLTIIDDIINISMIETGQLSVYKSDVDPALLLDNIHKYYKTLNLSAKFEIKLNPCPEVSIFSDESRIKQVITNLITNAIKNTKDGEINFGYTVNNEVLKFYVRDTGKGIPAGFENMLFERFFRIEDSTNLVQGTGLGLAICKAIASALDGEIWFESELGVGTTFFFTLPITN
ncbi:MAG: PAS domain S-box protein, partial [Bacteroidetes bacterium]|nr:PAS domain S-box protein [Bacteroidota bacterium]